MFVKLFIRLVVSGLCVFALRAAEKPLDQRLSGSVWTYPAVKADELNARIQFQKDGQLRVGWNQTAPLSTFHWKVTGPDTVELQAELDPRKNSTLKFDADFFEGTLTAEGKTWLVNNLTASGGSNLLASLTQKTVEKIGEGWQLKEGVLTGPQRTVSGISLPGEYPRNNYMIHARITDRVRRAPMFVVVLPVGDSERLAGLVLDRHGRLTQTSPLDYLTHFGPLRNERESREVVKGAQFAEGVTRKLQVAVSRNGDTVTAAAWLDGKELCHSTFPVAELRKFFDPRVAEMPRDQIGFLSYDSDWEVTSLRVTPLTPADITQLNEIASRSAASAAAGEAKPAAPQSPKWCVREMPKAGPTGWIALFDGKTLSGLGADFEPQPVARELFELQDDGLHLQGLLHFGIDLRDVIVRIRVNSDACELRLRGETGPKERRRGYVFYFYRSGGSIRLIDDEHGAPKDLARYTRLNTPESADYEISTIGNRIVMKVEGSTTAEIRDDTFATGGLSVNAIRPTVIKRIEIKRPDAK